MPKSELENLKATLRESKLEGKKVVFTNGVFDILHVGHVTYLEAAKQLGDLLVVGLNNDDSVRRLNKGPERPINGEQARARVLSALRAVDGVVIFGEDTPLDLINELQPDILVKGGDYNPEELDPEHPKYMVGSTEVRAWGGLVKTIPTVEGFSTTGIVKKLKS
ncbi:MAG: D-glycero-beta-D-manno-heptose 1-phosphate adenylyltransferase [Flavobacteriales bacterium]